MPFFSLPILEPGGPQLSAYVGISQARHNILTANKQTTPAPETIRALVDTGASCTCIDPSIVQALGLSPRGQTQVCTPTTGSSPEARDQYDVSLTILSPAGGPSLIRQNLLVVATDLLLPMGCEAVERVDQAKAALKAAMDDLRIMVENSAEGREYRRRHGHGS